MKLRIQAVAFAAVCILGCVEGCKDHSGGGALSSSANASMSGTPAMSAKPTANATATAPSTAAAPPTAASSSAAPPLGKAPPDGKYERVTVEGVTVPMIEVMDGGTVVLLDTDGKKPRTWEEQYKKKRESLAVGSFDIHKTDVNKNNKFDDDPIDKEGLWVIDEKGNITKH